MLYIHKEGVFGQFDTNAIVRNVKALTLPKAYVKLFNIEISLYKRGNILMKYITDEENCTAANITARSL